MTRPECFDFAMGFQDAEKAAAKVRAYVERLERERDQLVAALKNAVIIIDGAIYCGFELNDGGEIMLSEARAAIAKATED